MRLGMVLPRLLVLLAATSCTAGCAIWESSTITPEQLPPDLQAKATKTLKPLQLAKLGAPVQAEYRVQPGDLLEVTIPDLQGENHTYPIPTRVQEDGAIQLPLVGSVPVASFTLPEAEQVVASSCVARGVLRQPHVLVSLRQTKKVRVNVLGAVHKPGQYELNGTEADLLSALVAAGGVTEEADTIVEVHRRVAANRPPPRGEGAPGLLKVQHVVNSEGKATSQSPYNPRGSSSDMKPIPNGENQRFLRWDLANDQDQQSVAQGVYLQNGDTITVEERKLKPVYVIGMVNKPGEYKVPLAYDLRLLDAIGLAGGVDRSTLPNKVIVIRHREDNSNTVAIGVDLDHAKKDMMQNLALMPGDTVSVEETPASFMRGLLRSAFHIGLGADVAPAYLY